LTLSLNRLSFLLTSVQFIDIPSRKSTSEVNYAEIDFIFKLITYFQRYGVSDDRITILTPYRKQKFEFNRRLTDSSCSVSVFTIDEYQGEENDIILVSLTSSGKSPSSFLCDSRRLNVLTSRAKCGFIVCGDLYSFMRSAEWSQLIEIITNSQKNELSSRWGRNIPSKYNPHHFYAIQKNAPKSFYDWRPVRSLSEFDQILSSLPLIEKVNYKNLSPKKEEDEIEWINAHLNTLNVK
jgi:hypothetical protein